MLISILYFSVYGILFPHNNAETELDFNSGIIDGCSGVNIFLPYRIWAIKFKFIPNERGSPH